MSQRRSIYGDSRKVSVHIQPELLKEIREEAVRLDRSISWVVQRAWRVAKERIQGMKTYKDDE